MDDGTFDEVAELRGRLVGLEALFVQLFIMTGNSTENGGEFIAEVVKRARHTMASAVALEADESARQTYEIALMAIDNTGENIMARMFEQAPAKGRS